MIQSDTETVFDQIQSLGGSSSVTFRVALTPFLPYEAFATARDSNGNVVYYGETTITLTATTTATLNLLPARFDAGGDLIPWPTLQADDQAVGGSLGTLSLSANTSSAFLVDLSTSASEFTLASLPSGLSAFAQATDGTNLSLGTPPLKVTRAALGSETAFFLTFFQTGSDPLNPVGRFAIPVQTVTLSGVTAVAPGSTTDLTWSVTPANATNQAASDFTWSSSNPTILSVNAAGQVTAGTTGGSATITAVSQATGSVQGTLEMTVLGYTLRSAETTFWTDLQSKPTKAPAGSIALAGNATTLLALDESMDIHRWNNGFWSTDPVGAPEGSVGLALAADGTMAAATTTQVWVWSTANPVWTALPGTLPSPVQAIGTTATGWRVWSADGQFRSPNGGGWASDGFSTPTGTTLVAGSPGAWYALSGAEFQKWTGSVWVGSGLAVELDTKAATFALDRFVTLIVK